MKKGLFVVFEGIDGSGTSTHVHELTRKIENLDKYRDVLRTHEPWRNSEIKRKLQNDKDAYSEPEEMANLYIGDRTEHSYLLIRPNLDARVIVLCSRYKMSTCAFQQAQGMPLDKLLSLHENRGILTPDLTFFLDVPIEVAQGRLRERMSREKFEGDKSFINKVVNNYNKLVDLSQKNLYHFGGVVRINGNRPTEEVASDIYEKFLTLYKSSNL